MRNFSTRSSGKWSTRRGSAPSHDRQVIAGDDDPVCTQIAGERQVAGRGEQNRNAVELLVLQQLLYIARNGFLKHRFVMHFPPGQTSCNCDPYPPPADVVRRASPAARPMSRFASEHRDGCSRKTAQSLSNYGESVSLFGLTVRILAKTFGRYRRGPTAYPAASITTAPLMPPTTPLAVFGRPSDDYYSRRPRRRYSSSPASARFHPPPVRCRPQRPTRRPCLHRVSSFLTHATFGRSHGARYGRLNSRVASSSPTTCLRVAS